MNIQSMLLFYLLWISMHYASSHIYTFFCTPYTISGFFLSPFIVVTPHCSAIRWVLYEGGNIITNMWLVSGTYMASKLLMCKQNSE